MCILINCTYYCKHLDCTHTVHSVWSRVTTVAFLNSVISYGECLPTLYTQINYCPQLWLHHIIYCNDAIIQTTPLIQIVTFQLLVRSAYQQQWYANIHNTYYPSLGILISHNKSFLPYMIPTYFAVFSAILPAHRHSRTILVFAASPRPCALVWNV